MKTGRTGLEFGILRLDARDFSSVEVDEEIIRVLGFGRYRKAMEGIRRLRRISNDEFRFANAGKGGTTKYAKDANGEGGVSGEAGLERGVAGSGGYRQLAAVAKKLRVERRGVESGGGKEETLNIQQWNIERPSGEGMAREKGRLEVEVRSCESTVDTWGAYLYFLFVNTVRMPRIYSSGIFIAVVRTGMFAEHKMGPERLRVK